MERIGADSRRISRRVRRASPNLQILHLPAESVEKRVFQVFDDDVLRLSDDAAHELPPRDVGSVGMQQRMRRGVDETQLLQAYYRLRVTFVSGG